MSSRFWHPQTREMVARVYHYLKKEYEMLLEHNFDNCDYSPLSNIVKRTAAATGVSQGTVTQILKEERECVKENPEASPSRECDEPVKKKRKRKNKTGKASITEDDIRNTIENYRTENDKMPSLAELQKLFKDKFGFSGSLNAYRAILKDLGYKKRELKTLEITKSDGENDGETSEGGT